MHDLLAPNPERIEAPTFNLSLLIISMLFTLHTYLSKKGHVCAVNTIEVNRYQISNACSLYCAETLINMHSSQHIVVYIQCWCVQTSDIVFALACHQWSCCKNKILNLTILLRAVSQIFNNVTRAGQRQGMCTPEGKSAADDACTEECFTR